MVIVVNHGKMAVAVVAVETSRALWVAVATSMVAVATSRALWVAVATSMVAISTRG